MGQSSPDFLRV